MGSRLPRQLIGRGRCPQQCEMGVDVKVGEVRRYRRRGHKPIVQRVEGFTAFPALWKIL